MLVTYAVLCEISVAEFAVCEVSNLLMIGFGALASYCSPPHNYVYLALSFLFYFPVIYYINRMLEMAIERFSAEQRDIRQAFNSARLVMLAGWVAMPSIWVLSWMRAVDPATEEVLYQIIDFLTKCGCSAMLMHSSIRTQADWEAERSRSALAEERERMVALLEQTTLQRHKFFAALSAQLRSPLVSMAGLIEEMLKNDAETSTDEQIAHLNAFVTAGTHLVFTIDDMLALSQKKQKQRGALLPVSMWEVDVEDMVNQMVPLARGLTSRPLDFQVHCEPDMPKARVDVRRAHQALHNVLSYVAHCAVEADGTAVEIWCRASPDRGSVTVEMHAPAAQLAATQAVRDIIQNKFGSLNTDISPTVPDTLASLASFGDLRVGPEDAACDESLQCLLIAKDLLFETGGTCSLSGTADDKCALIVVLPSFRSRAFVSPSFA